MNTSMWKKPSDSLVVFSPRLAITTKDGVKFEIRKRLMKMLA